MSSDTTENATPHTWVEDMAAGETVRGSYLVKEKRLGTTRGGKAFISITLADRTGDVEAKVWDRAEEVARLFTQGDVVEVEGDADSYRGQVQVSISRLAVPQEEADPRLFVSSAPREAPEMMASLRELLGEIRNAHLKALTTRFLRDKGFLALFSRAPAAKNFHHAYVGGLLEHTLSVCRMAGQVAGQYPQLDKDLLLAAAFLHDIGKMRELKLDLQIAYTDEGRLLGHVVLGVGMVDEKLKELKGFPEDLAVRVKHLILSHHGQYEFGSPKRPKFIEAFALHLIDDLDAKINGVQAFISKDRQEGSWTEFNRLFDRYFLKGEIACEGVVSDAASDAHEKQGTLF